MAEQADASEGARVGRVIVADDHPLFRSALDELFSRAADFEVVGATGSLAEAEQLLASTRCDLVLLDLRLPDVEGLSGVRRLKERWPVLRILLISGALGPEIVRDALAAGASGLVPKSFDPGVIVAAARLVLAGGLYVPPELTPALPAAPAASPVPAGAAPGAVLEEALTPRETELLRRFSRGESNKEIARALGLAEITIKVSTQKIVRKLGVKNRIAAVAKALADGLL